MQLFEAARARPGDTYDPDRFLAYLTRTPATKGKHVADTFAGRRRLVRFIEAVQLELGVCFSNEDWERGFTLAQLVALIEKKASNPGAGLRLARERARRARRQLLDAPIKVGVLAAALIVAVVLVESTPIRLGLGGLWLVITGGVGLFAWRDYTYCRKLVERMGGTERV